MNQFLMPPRLIRTSPCAKAKWKFPSYLPPHQASTHLEDFSELVLQSVVLVLSLSGGREGGQTVLSAAGRTWRAFGPPLPSAAFRPYTWRSRPPPPPFSFGAIPVSDRDRGLRCGGPRVIGSEREGGREGWGGLRGRKGRPSAQGSKPPIDRVDVRVCPSVRRSPNDRQSAARLNDNAGSYGRGWKDGCEGREGKGPSVSVERKWAAEIARRVSTQEGYAGIYLSFIMSSVRLMPKISFLYDVLSLHVELGGEN